MGDFADFDTTKISDWVVEARRVLEANMRARWRREIEAKETMAALGWSHDPFADAAAALDPGRTAYINCMLNALDTDLMIASGRLSAWEASFVASIADQFDRRGTLTDKQMETLERIYAEKAE